MAELLHLLYPVAGVSILAQVLDFAVVLAIILDIQPVPRDGGRRGLRSFFHRSRHPAPTTRPRGPRSGDHRALGIPERRDLSLSRARRRVRPRARLRTSRSRQHGAMAELAMRYWRGGRA